MRRALLAAVGLSPQVVTETLCAYAARRPRVLFDEIHLVTTEAGLRRVRETLLGQGGRPGAVRRFCEDYGLPRPRFDEGTITVLGAGRPLDDIRSEESGSGALREILGVVRRLTADPDLDLFGSVAGGRKTMGVFLAVAFQLYGRPGDRLSHVLVSEAVESSPDFFYPPPGRKRYRLRDRSGRLRNIPAEKVRVELHEIPFVRLRKHLAGRSGDYPALVNGVQEAVDACPSGPVRVSLGRRTVSVGEYEAKLRPTEIALYALLAERRKACAKKACRGCARCFLAPDELTAPPAVDRFLEYYGRVVGRSSGYFDNMAGGIRKKDAAFFRENRSKITRKLADALPGGADGPARIVATGRYAETRYGIAAPGDMVQVED